MKTYIPGNYELLSIDENFIVDKSNKMRDMIDYAYYIPEDGQVAINGKSIPVKAGDVVLYMYTINKYDDKGNHIDTDEPQQAIVLNDGAYKDYLIKSYESDKKRYELRKALEQTRLETCDGDCVNCEKCSI